MGHSSARTRSPAEPSAGAGAAAPGGGTREPAPLRNQSLNYSGFKRPPETPKLCSTQRLYGFQHREQGSSAGSSQGSRRGGRGNTFTRRKCSLYTSACKQRLQSAPNQFCAINKTAPKWCPTFFKCVFVRMLLSSKNFPCIYVWQVLEC